ncbi:MAG TPA: polysaccharide pyruvyl transferase family protein [Opitutaceae bacterium]|nr:polysaccharide pyruvyl transferase family protein [Opitutaceae bacterium]
MRVGLITTLKTNIGDDFIREGICNVLRGLASREAIEFVPINKHTPDMLYPRWHPLAVARSLPVAGYRKKLAIRKLSRVFKYVGFTAFDRCDAIVQCGAPVYWEGCGQNTRWKQDLWEDVVQRLHRKIPVLNLAAGSCFPYRKQPERFELPADRKYVRWLHSLCRATSVRDPLAHKLLAAEDCDTHLIRCSAFLFTNPSEARPSTDGPILINYMRGGGHYDLGQQISADRWENTVRQLISRLKAKGHRVALVCHNETELKLAREIAPDCDIRMPKTFREFPEMVRDAKAAICNRMHASVALAGLGIPSVTVGTDTRMLMVEQLEMPCYFVEDAELDAVERDVERLIAQREQIAARLRVLQRATRDSYAHLLEKTLFPQDASRAAAVEASQLSTANS